MENLSEHYTKQVEEKLAQIKQLLAEIRWMVKGQTATIRSDFNGQPWRHSKPSLKGKRVLVEDISLGTWMGLEREGLSVFVEGQQCSLPFKELELDVRGRCT